MTKVNSLCTINRVDLVIMKKVQRKLKSKESAAKFHRNSYDPETLQLGLIKDLP